MGATSILELVQASASVGTDDCAGVHRAFMAVAECVVRRTLQRWAGGVVVRRGQLEDVTQEALLRVWINRARCRAGSDAEAAGWIATIARFTAVDTLRAAFRMPTISIDVEAPVSLLIESDGESKGPAERLAWLSWALAESDSTVLWHRLVLSQEWREIGTSLGISWTAARRRYQRALSRLRVLALQDPEIRRSFSEAPLISIGRRSSRHFCHKDQL